jgi:hypothetical protein
MVVNDYQQCFENPILMPIISIFYVPKKNSEHFRQKNLYMNKSALKQFQGS